MRRLANSALGLSCFFSSGRTCSSTKKPIIPEAVPAESAVKTTPAEISDVAAAFRRMAAGIPDTPQVNSSLPTDEASTVVSQQTSDDERVPTIQNLTDASGLSDNPAGHGGNPETVANDQRSDQADTSVSSKAQSSIDIQAPKFSPAEFSILDPNRKGATSASEAEILHDLKRAARQGNKQRMETLLLEVHDRMALELLVSRSSGKLVLSGLDDQLAGVVSKHLNRVQVAKRSELAFGSYQAVETILFCLWRAPLDVLMMEEAAVIEKRDKFSKSSMKVRNHIMSTGKTTIRVFPLIEVGSKAFRHTTSHASVLDSASHPPSIEVLAEALLRCNSFSNEHLFVLIAGLTTRLTRLCADCTPVQAVRLRFLAHRCALLDVPAVTDTLTDTILGAVRSGKLNPCLQGKDRSTVSGKEGATDAKTDDEENGWDEMENAEDRDEELSATAFLTILQILAPQDINFQNESAARRPESSHWSDDDAKSGSSDGRVSGNTASDLDLWRLGLNSILASAISNCDKCTKSRGELQISLPKGALKLPESLTSFTFSGAQLERADDEDSRVPLVLVNIPPRKLVRFSSFLQDSLLLENLLKITTLTICQGRPYDSFDKMKQLSSFVQFGVSLLNEYNPQVKDWVCIYLANLVKALIEFLWPKGRNWLIDGLAQEAPLLEKFCSFASDVKNLQVKFNGLRKYHPGDDGGSNLGNVLRVLYSRCTELLFTATCGPGVTLEGKDRQALTGLSTSGWLVLVKHLGGVHLVKNSEVTYRVSTRGEIYWMALSVDELPPPRSLALAFQVARLFARVKDENRDALNEIFFSNSDMHGVSRLEAWKAFLANTRALQDFVLHKDEEGRIARTVPKSCHAFTTVCKLCRSLVAEVRNHWGVLSDRDFTQFLAAVRSWHQAPAAHKNRTGKDVKMLNLPSNFTDRDLADLLPRGLTWQKIRRADSREFGYVVTFESNVDAEMACLKLDGISVNGREIKVAPARVYKGKIDENYVTKDLRRENLPSFRKSHKERVFQPQGERAWLPARHTFKVGDALGDQLNQRKRTKITSTSSDNPADEAGKVVCTRFTSAVVLVRFYLDYQSRKAFHAENIHLRTGQHVIVDCDRTIDLARVDSVAPSDYKYLKGRILRPASRKELADHKEVKLQAAQVFEKVKTIIHHQYANHVEVLNVYMTLDWKKITVYLKRKKESVDMVEVRNLLVDTLHKEYHARIWIEFVGTDSRGKQRMRNATSKEIYNNSPVDVQGRPSSSTFTSRHAESEQDSSNTERKTSSESSSDGDQDDITVF